MHVINIVQMSVSGDSHYTELAFFTDDAKLNHVLSQLREKYPSELFEVLEYDLPPLNPNNIDELDLCVSNSK